MNSLDFVFTSLFCLGHEQYGDEEEQSFNKLHNKINGVRVFYYVQYKTHTQV